jgi:hypothetical protein
MKRSSHPVSKDIPESGSLNQPVMSPVTCISNQVIWLHRHVSHMLVHPMAPQQRTFSSKTNMLLACCIHQYRQSYYYLTKLAIIEKHQLDQNMPNKEGFILAGFHSSANTSKNRNVFIIL